MTKTEKLTEKCIIVIESCSTYDQLLVAAKYTSLAIKQILQNKGFDKYTQSYTLANKLSEHHIKLLRSRRDI